MSFFNQLRRKFMDFMSGRNGMDQLSFACLLISLGLQVLGGVFGSSLFLLLSIALYAWTLFRVFSRKSYKREEENKKFLSLWSTVKTKARQYYLRLKGVRQYKYFHCPQCKALLRLTRGQGEKEICCPKCQNRFRQKS